MRACYVLLRFPVPSETFVRDEIAALREAGHSVLTVSIEGGPGADLALATRRARSGWVLRRALALLARRPAAALRAWRLPALSPGLRLKLLAAAEEARRAGVDAVHAHFAYRNADAAAVIGTALGTGHSLTAHARDIFVPSGDLASRLEAARTVVTVCRYNRDFLLARFPRLEPKLVVIPCSTRITARVGGAGPDHHPDGADPDRRPDEGGGVVLAIGRLVEKKGFDDLLSALALTRQPCRLVLIGSGPLEGPLTGRAGSLGLSGRLTMLGELDHAGALGWLARADVFCLPCKVAADGDRDSMPVVVKEAMAAGLAVVSTREVGVPEMVEDGVTGLLVPPSDPAALAGALDRVLADPELRRAMGRAGAALVAERFDLRDQARAVAAAIGPRTRATLPRP